MYLYSIVWSDGTHHHFYQRKRMTEDALIKWAALRVAPNKTSALSDRINADNDFMLFEHNEKMSDASAQMLKPMLEAIYEAIPFHNGKRLKLYREKCSL